MDRKELETLNKLIEKALKIRENTKLYQDMKFLEDIFTGRLKWVPTNYKTKKLASIYSVSRTLNPNLTNEDYEKLFSRGKKEFKTYAKNKKEPVPKSLRKFLLQTTNNEKNLGSKKKGNKIASFLTKCAYYYTKKDFPIYDTYSEKYMKQLHKNIIGIELKESGCIAHLNRYAEVLAHFKQKNVKGFRNNKYKLIDGIDCFLWLYGIMRSAATDDKNAPKGIIYSSTCGNLTDYRDWYMKAHNFMTNKK